MYKYNANAKYSTEDLRGGHNSNNFPYWIYTWMKKDL